MIKLEKVEIKKDIYWVGGVDWGIRNFHGYSTNRGTTYNAYLIMDKKITLVLKWDREDIAWLFIKFLIKL